MILFPCGLHNQMYVQDVLRKKLVREVMRILHWEQGHLYICGNGGMVQDVTNTVQDILAKQLELNPTAAVEYMAQLKVGIVFLTGTKHLCWYSNSK